MQTNKKTCAASSGFKAAASSSTQVHVHLARPPPYTFIGKKIPRTWVNLHDASIFAEPHAQALVHGNRGDDGLRCCGAAAQGARALGAREALRRKLTRGFIHRVARFFCGHSVVKVDDNSPAVFSGVCAKAFHWRVGC
jgi:hypothetical protein